MFSKDRRAYSYLPESVEVFPEGQNFMDILTEVGYSEVSSIRLSGGIATIYLGTKMV
jgi:demethylmenaquinone methyltransferase/2-methoxy-6-polyprenyl-1,4-benzoquinol methylase